MHAPPRSTLRNHLLILGLTAIVSSLVIDDAGRVVIPTGSTLHLTISVLQPANDTSAANGNVLVLLRAMTLGGREFSVTGEVTSMAHVLKASDVVVAAGTPTTVTLRGPVTISFQ